MTKEKGFNKHAWLIMMVLSLLFIAWTLFVFSRGDAILPMALKLAGSPLVVESLDEAALGSLNMAMLKPLWEEIWIGVLGVFCALGLKQKRKYAWILGILWSVMLLTNGAIQGGYELFILKWSNACLQTYLFLLFGMIALATLLIARKEFS